MSFTNTIVEIEGISGLKAYPIANNPTTAILKGYYSGDDGGGGLFRWNPTSTRATNSGTIFNSNYTSNGRWERIYSSPLNVKWFGAKGTNQGDDTEAIQNAIESVFTGAYINTISHTQGGKLFIPAGIYPISNTIVVNRPVHIEGESYFKPSSNAIGPIFGTVIKSNINNSSKDIISITGYIPESVVTASGLRTTKLSNFSIYGAGTERDGINFNNSGFSYDIQLEHLKIWNVGRTCVRFEPLAGSIAYFKLGDIECVKPREDGIYLSNGYSAEMVGTSLRNFYGSLCGRSALFAQNINHLHIDNFTENDSTGSAVHLDRVKRSTFVNIKTETNSGYGLYLTGCNRNSFIDLKITKPNSGCVLLTGNCYSNNFLGTDFELNSAQSIYHVTASSNSHLNNFYGITHTYNVAKYDPLNIYDDASASTENGLNRGNVFRDVINAWGGDFEGHIIKKGVSKYVVNSQTLFSGAMDVSGAITATGGNFTLQGADIILSNAKALRIKNGAGANQIVVDMSAGGSIGLGGGEQPININADSSTGLSLGQVAKMPILIQRTGTASATLPKVDSNYLAFRVGYSNESETDTRDTTIRAVVVNSGLLYGFAFRTSGIANAGAHDILFIGSNSGVGINCNNNPNSAFQVSGAIATTYSKKTANYTLNRNDSIIGFDCSVPNNNITGTFPNPTGIIGRMYYIKKLDNTANKVYLTGHAENAITIDGALNYQLTSQYQSVQIISDGENYLVV